MLYWHMGLKRTGTTSLQTALVVRQRQLAEVGVLYPEEWRVDGIAGYSTHQGLVEVMRAPGGDHPPVRHFLEYLNRHGDSKILLSSELVTDWLEGSRLEAVLRILALAGEVTPVTCMWTLRRLDEAVNSHRLRRVLRGRDLIPPAEDEVPRLVESFAAALAGMRRIEEAVGGRSRYFKYERDGGHNSDILRAIDLPIEVRRSVENALGNGPRLNSQLTHKAAAAMRYRGVISERVGAPIGESELQTAFFLGEFEFDDDRPCELMGERIRTALHERALEAAREQDCIEYLSFFGADKIESGPPVPIDPGVLSDEDLQRLVSYLHALRQSDIDSIIGQRYGSVQVGDDRLP